MLQFFCWANFMAQVESENTENKCRSSDNGKDDSEKLVILCRKVVHQKGCFSRVIDYVAGHHPKLGKLNGYKGGGKGWQEKETIWEHDSIVPLKTFMVEDPEIT